VIQVHEISTATDFIFLVVLGCIGLYSYQLSFRRKETLLILRSVYDGNVSDQLFRKDNRLIERSVYTLLVTSLVLIGAFTTWWLADVGLMASLGYHQMLIGVVCASIVYALRYTTLQLLGSLGSAREVTNQVAFDLKTIIGAVGILILPLAIFAIFGVGALGSYSGFVVVALLCLSGGFFLIKGAIISLRSNKVKFLHLFYYFCALEILPLVWAYRILLN
jgi:hypothetical protein